MKRAEKESFVKDIRAELTNASTVIAVNRSFGITVEEITGLRKDMRKSKANIKVLKNTLAKIAIRNSHLEQLEKFLEGPTALAYSDDSVGLAKVLSDFAKKNEKMTILAGVMDGKFIPVETVRALASLPSLDELRGKIVGLLTAAAVKIVRTVKEPSLRIARVVALKS